MSEQANQLPVQPQYPTVNDRDIWHAYWQERGPPWRTEPEIDGSRQAYLAECLATKPDSVPRYLSLQKYQTRSC